MNMKKRFVALLLAISLIYILPCSIHASSAETKISSSVAFINALNITERTAEDSEQILTRGEFMDMVMRALNSDVNVPGNSPFSDVAASNPYFGAVCRAYELGIIAGNETGLFCPNDPLSMAAALKITVSALGYNSLAAAKGGYPAGYLSVANQINLLRGVSESNAGMTYGNCAVLLYNFLNADLFESTGVDGENLTQRRADGKCILTEYYNYEKTEGVIETAGFVSTVPGYKSREAKLTIAGRSFNSEIENVDVYLGFDVICWYDDSETAKAIYVKPANSVIKIDAEDISRYFNNTLYIIDSETGKESSYDIDSAFSFVKNGRGKTPVKDDFEIKEGSIRLIDNNQDDSYDVVLVEEPEYMVVSSVDVLKGCVYDSNSGRGPLRFSKQNGDYYEFSIKSKNSIDEAHIEDITTNAVLMYYRSEDGQYLKTIGSTNTLEGTITEIRDDKVYIDGTEYAVNSYFKENTHVAVGYSGVFLFAADNTLTYITDSMRSDLSYGYYVDYNSEKGLGGEIKIALLTSNGAYISPQLAEKVTLDGVRMEQSDARIRDTLIDVRGIPKYQLIRYELDAEGKVKTIDTAEDIDANLDTADKYNRSYIGNNALKRFSAGLTSYYHGSTNQFAAHALTDSAVMISVPSSIADASYTERLDKDLFKISSSANLSNASYTIDLYDMDKTMRAGAIIIYNDNIGAKGKIDRSANACVVKSVTDALWDDGEILKTIAFWDDGKFYKYPIAQETYDLIKGDSETMPAAGDVIRYTLDSSGRIEMLSVDAKYDAASEKPKMTPSAHSGNQLDHNEYIGKVLYHNGTGITVKLEPPYGYSTGYGSTLDVTDYLCPFIVNTNTKIALYDSQGGIVRQGDLSLLCDGFSVGEENASYVFIKSYTNVVDQLIIYR